MTSWRGLLIVIGWMSMMNGNPLEAKDHPIAKFLPRIGPAYHAGDVRVCEGRDLPGDWHLVTFDSSYRFRNPQAPYLFPHQLFQYSTHGGTKSVHSLRPILGRPDKIFQMVPLEMTYHVERNGRVILNTKGHDKPVEAWSCELVTRSRVTMESGSGLQRGDLIMTLLGSGGQPLFVRHLRKTVT
ncbi:MAG: exported protein of unknown function [Nitrospira sp.]|jgi:hypothetical protein|nr:exported protein of unknown function [Nitrospira sp.]